MNTTTLEAPVAESTPAEVFPDTTAEDLFGSDPEPAHMLQAAGGTDEVDLDALASEATGIPTEKDAPPGPPTVVPTPTVVAPPATPNVPVVAPVPAAPQPVVKPTDLTPEQLQVAREVFMKEQAAAGMVLAPASAVTPAVAPAAKAPLTVDSEEFKKATNFYEVSPDQFQKVFNAPDVPTAAKEMTNIVQGAVRQALTMTHVLLEESKRQIAGHIAPYTQMADQMREQELANQFYAEHQDLVGQDQVVNHVTRELHASGFRATDLKQLRDTVAARSKALIASLANGQTPAVAQPQVPAVPSVVKPTMTVLTRGGGGGGGSGQPAGVPGQDPTAVSLFGS